MLNEREKTILKCIVELYIDNAEPVGSRTIARKYDLGISAATIRNVMYELEEKAFINQPYTSAGRIPSDKGYRFYLDFLVTPENLTAEAKKIVDEQLNNNISEIKDIFNITSHILSRMSSNMGVSLTPELKKSMLNKIEIIKVASSRLLFIITLNIGFVKTYTINVNFNLDNINLENESRKLNERIAGLAIDDIRQNMNEYLKDCSLNKNVLDTIKNISDDLFLDVPEESLFYAGINIMLKQPEFIDKEKLEAVLDLIEKRERIFKLIHDSAPKYHGIEVKIGAENHIEGLNFLTSISASYNIGENHGIIGIISPKRVNYRRIISVMSYISHRLEDLFKEMM